MTRDWGGRDGSVPNAFVHVLSLVLVLKKKKKMLLLASLYVFITQCNKLYFQYSCQCVIKCFYSPVNLPKTPRYCDEQKVYFSSFYHQKHWHLSDVMLSPSVPFWRHSEIHLCAFARPANQMAERKRRPITAQDLHHSLTNGDTALSVAAAIDHRNAAANQQLAS